MQEWWLIKRKLKNEILGQNRIKELNGNLYHCHQVIYNGRQNGVENIEKAQNDTGIRKHLFSILKSKP